MLIADIEVQDAETYARYRNTNPDIVQRFGGWYLAVGGRSAAAGGGLGAAPLHRRKSCTYAPSQRQMCLHTCLHTAYTPQNPVFRGVLGSASSTIEV